MFIKFCLEQKRAKLLLLVITVVTLLSSCTSVHNITNGSCNVARQSQACHDKCSGFDGDERPLWCYRLFCVHGSPIYGSWCDGLDPNMLPTQTELDQQKANPAFQKFIGTANAPDASKVSDNGFAFLSVVASNRVTPADKVAIGYVGEGVGGHSNNTMIENIKRKVIVYEGQNAIIFPEDEVRLPSGEFQNANGTITISGTPVSVALISPTGSNYVIGSDGKYYYARGGTSHVAKILGFTYNNDTTMGSANKDALVNDSLAAYNPFDFVMFNNYSSDPTKVVIGGAMPTNGWSKADMNSGSNYRFLSEKINLSITNFLSQNVDIVSNSNNKFVLNLGFEGFRDGRQLANGFDILRTVGTSSAGNGIFGEYGENNVSYMLVNTCSPDDINCQGAFAGTKSFLNGTFASGLQMLFDGTRFYTGGQGANISSGYMHKGGNNFDISDINQVSQKIYETLSDSNYENGLFVVSSGFSSVNNTGGAKDLFYKSNTNFVPGEDNGMATTDDWYSERVWYKSSNIFQTTGGVSNKFYDYENTPLGSARSKFTPNYLFGNTTDQSSTVCYGSSSSCADQREWYLIADQSIIGDLTSVSGGLIDMRYTGNYPSAFLHNLWSNNYDKSTADANWSIFRMDTMLSWSNAHYLGDSTNKSSASDMIYADRSGNTETKLAQFMLGAGNSQFGDGNSYASSDAYRFLIAGAFDSTADNGNGSLVAYTNAAGALKYNYLTVSVNPYQDTLAGNESGSHVSEQPPTPPVNPNGGDSSGNYEVVNDFYKKYQDSNGEWFAKYSTSPSLLASSMLTGYAQYLLSLFSNVSGNDIAFALRNTATQMYGKNYGLEVDGETRDINQASFYFTNSIKDEYDSTAATVDNEQSALNFLNASGSRDVFVFEGVDNAMEYDDMYKSMFGESNSNGTVGLGGNMFAPEMFGEGHVTANTSFFVGKGEWEYDSATNMIIGTVGDQTYYRTVSAFQHLFNTDPNSSPGDAMKESEIKAALKKLNNYNNIDPGVNVEGTGKGNDANSFLTIDTGSKFDTKFNWESKPRMYYEMNFLGCDNTSECTQSKYHEYLTKYYDALNVPENERALVDLNIESDGTISICTAQQCSYKYSIDDFDKIHLSNFNEHNNTVMFAVEDDKGAYNYADKRVNIEILVLDPAIIACPNSGCANGIVENVQEELKFFYELNKVIDNTSSNNQAEWQAKLQSLGIENIKDARISDQCLEELSCSNDDLTIMFKLMPDLFSRAPSNVFGYGNVDLEDAYYELQYQDTYFYQGVTGNLSRQLQQFFYSNEDCQNYGTNCGINLSDEMGFLYLPDKMHPDLKPGDNTSGATSGGSDQAFVKTPYGDKYIDTDDIMNSVGYVNGHAGMNIGFILGAMGPAMGYNNMMSVQTKKNSTGGQLSINMPTMTGSIMIGGSYYNTNDFSRYAVTSVDMNTDKFGYAIIDGVTSMAIGMVSGLRFNQELSESAQMKVMFFGNKNEHDLINTNPIGKIFIGNSIYMLSGNQQGMFGNPYFRYAGSFAGSIYSFSGNVTSNLTYRVSSVQTYNPVAGMMSINSIGSSVGNTSALSSMLGFGSSSGNSLQEIQLMYSGKSESSYSMGYGMLNENGTLLGSQVNPGGTSNTYYVDAKAIQHLGKGYYLMGHYNIGFLNIQSIASNVFFNFNNFMAQKFSVGLIKTNFFGGSLFFTYTEPNRLLSGTATTRAFDSEGNINNSVGSVDFAHTGFAIERNYELGYSFKYKGYNIAISSMLRTNPYAIKTVSADGLMLLRINGFI